MDRQRRKQKLPDTATEVTCTRAADCFLYSETYKPTVVNYCFSIDLGFSNIPVGKVVLYGCL